MKELAAEFGAYTWAPPSDEVARLAGIDPSQVIRFDQNTPPLPLPRSRPGRSRRALVDQRLSAGRLPRAARARSPRYNGVEPGERRARRRRRRSDPALRPVLGGPGRHDRDSRVADVPLYRIAAQLAGREVGDDDPVLTFTCRPNNPDGALRPLPEARPLVVDEAYFEYCGETAMPLLEDGVIVLRTFSKAFALAGARIGYALADREVADE